MTFYDVSHILYIGNVDAKFEERTPLITQIFSGQNIKKNFKFFKDSTLTVNLEALSANYDIAQPPYIGNIDAMFEEPTSCSY